MIALNVRTYLEKNGMSVYEFAHKSGVSPKVIRQMISGSEEGSNHIFNSAPIGKVAAAIGADADVLVSGIADEEQRHMITGAIAGSHEYGAAPASKIADMLNVEESFVLDVIESGGEAETPRKKEKERNTYDKG